MTFSRIIQWMAKEGQKRDSTKHAQGKAFPYKRSLGNLCYKVCWA